MKLQSDPQLVADTPGSGCAWEKHSCLPRLTFISIRSRGKSANVLRYPEVHLHLSPSDDCLLGSSTESAVAVFELYEVPSQ